MEHLNSAILHRKMMQRLTFIVALLGIGGGASWGQAMPAAQVPSAPNPTASIGAQTSAGGILRGVVKSGTTPLPGVTILATNTLTGAAFTTVTDVRGQYAMQIPKNGRYVVQADFAGFAVATTEALLNASHREQESDLTLMLASCSSASSTGAHTAGGGLPLQALGNLEQAAGMAGALENAGPSLSGAAASSDISTESVAVNGQTGTVNPFANIDQSQLQQRLDDMRAQQSLSQIPGQGGGRHYGPPHGGGGFFKHFNPTQPHGSVFYSGGNSVLNALPFSVTGAPVVQPAYNSNNAGFVFVGPPQIPGLLKPSTKNFMFVGLFITRNSSPFNQYASVPTLAERGGDFSKFTGSGTTVIPIYDPTTGQQFSGNQIPTGDISPQAQALLQYIPLPNQPNAQQNFQYLTTSQSNSTHVGMRFTHNFGSGGGGAALPPFLRNLMGQANHGLTQNGNVNFNFNHAASDLVSVFPQLGGANQTYSYSIQAGYVLGYNRWTLNTRANLNRNDAQVSNFFTGRTDVAAKAGSQGLGATTVNDGVPILVFSQFNGVNEQAPSTRLSQTIAGEETVSWTGKKHNVRFGGDYRWLLLNVEGGTNATGSFYFTGFATRAPNASSVPGQQASGVDFADFLLGLPQEATVQQGSSEYHLRSHVYDMFAQDDWHARKNLTLNAGLRYEFYAPYTETQNRLANLDFSPNLSTLAVVLPDGMGPVHGQYPRALIHPDRTNFSPRVGFSWRPFGNIVVRGGYGINTNTGQYARMIQNLAYQPPFANSLTNIVPAQSAPSLTLATALTRATSPSGITNNFAVNPNYRLGYVQVWSLDAQKSLPQGIVLNVGYNGAHGANLDLVDAPNRQLSGLLNPAFPSFTYEDSIGFSRFNALVVRVRKRLQNGFSVGATYTYAHSIDDASSIGGSTAVVAQNQSDIQAEEGNSSFDIRHQIKGDWLYELPFGPDERWITPGPLVTGWLAPTLSNLSLSGSFDLATGTPLSPNYSATSADVARGTAGSQRPNRVPGTSLTAGGGSLHRWFNLAAFAPPVNATTGAPEYGNASRNSIPGPGTIQTNMSLSKTMHFGGNRSMEVRATANNVFNTVQYATVDSSIDSLTAGQVTGVGNMRQITLQARFRY